MLKPDIYEYLLEVAKKALDYYQKYGNIKILSQFYLCALLPAVFKAYSGLNTLFIFENRSFFTGHKIPFLGFC